MGKHKRKREGKDEVVKKRKHYDTFYASAPPGLIKEKQERPEESIPDLPENHEARDFLAHAPSKGLWMPLGKEVKVMQCWRCKKYGHRTGDRECPMFVSGNTQTERFRWSHEDPMHNYIKEQDKRDKEERVKQLQALLVSSSSSSSDEDMNKSEHEHRKKKKRKKKPERTEKNEKYHESDKSKRKSRSVNRKHRKLSKHKKGKEKHQYHKIQTQAKKK